MRIIKTEIPEILIIEPKRIGDSRGFFTETFRAETYAAAGMRHAFVQDNWSRSKRGVLRGLHLQNPNAQGKLVTAARGEILDVAVDVRTGSPTFGRHVAVRLSEENGRQLYIPRGFAHGFLVLSDTADFFYKCDAYYSPADELAIRWDDPAIGIEWPVADPILSARDASAPLLSQVSRLPKFSA